jgi:hypothetical protein
MRKSTKELVQEITDYLNTFNSKEKEFCEAMSCEHRTLQQSFTKLCLQWIEHCASDEYRIDGRNEQSQKIARELLEGFKDKQIKEGFTGETLKLMSKPSGYLSCI